MRIQSTLCFVWLYHIMNKHLPSKEDENDFLYFRMFCFCWYSLCLSTLSQRVFVSHVSLKFLDGAQAVGLCHLWWTEKKMKSKFYILNYHLVTFMSLYSLQNLEIWFWMLFSFHCYKTWRCRCKSHHTVCFG